MNNTSRISRRSVIGAAAGIACAAAAPAWAAPGDKPVRIIVGYPAGSTMDTLARMIAVEVQDRMKVAFIVENKPGANGTIGAEFVAHAPPDGTTLFIAGSSTHSANPALIRGLRYDPIRDFTPVIEIATLTYALVVNASQPAQTMADLVREAKSRPAGLTFAHGSQLGLIAASSISKIAGMQTTGVPYKGQPQVLTDLIGGHVDFTVADVPVLLPHIRSGKLRPLAVLNATRSPLLPDVPTLQEQGLTGYDLLGWVGLEGPAGMPPDITRALSKSFAEVLSVPAFRARLLAMGMEWRPNTPEEFGNTVSQQLNIWAQKVKDAGIKSE